MLKIKNKKSRPFLVVELLNSFTKRELADLADFVSCDYHNTDRHVVDLLDVLREQVIYQRDFDETTQCITYSKIFPSKTIPNKSLNQQQKSLLLAKMAILLRLAETFLAHESLKENVACKTELLYEQLLKRNQVWLFKRQVTKDNKTLKSQTEHGKAHYAHQFKVESGVLTYLYQNGLITKEDNLPKLIEALDIYYILNKLDFHFTCLSLSRFSAQKSYDYRPMNAIEPLLQLPQYSNHPLIRTKLIATALLQKNNYDDYVELLNLLNAYAENIPYQDLNDFYKIAGNFCSKKITEGHSEFYQHAFDLYRIMDGKKLLQEGNFMPISKLKNIISVSCRLNEFDWAREIIEKYRSILQKQYAESVYHFNMGAVAFYQNDFKTAIRHFIRVEKVNLSYDMDCRIMLLKSHYELDNEYDERSIRTFLLSERFIQSHKGLITRDKKAYKNFVRILINIYNTRHGAGKMTPEKVRRKLEKLEFVSDKKWLEEKIAELPKK